MHHPFPVLSPLIEKIEERPNKTRKMTGLSMSMNSSMMMMSNFCIPQYCNVLIVAHCAVLLQTRGKQGSSRQSGAGAGAVQLHSYTVTQSHKVTFKHTQYRVTRDIGYCWWKEWHDDWNVFGSRGCSCSQEVIQDYCNSVHKSQIINRQDQECREWLGRYLV